MLSVTVQLCIVTDRFFPNITREVELSRGRDALILAATVNLAAVALTPRSAPRPNNTSSAANDRSDDASMGAFEFFLIPDH